MFTYSTVLPLIVSNVERALRQQVRDSDHPAHGAFLTDGYGGGFPSADHVSNALYLTMACQVYLAPGSQMEDDEVLLQRICDSIAFQRRWQRPSGLIDLAARNIESPPDTGFTVQALAHVVIAARRKSESRGAKTIATELGEYVRTAALGMIDKGFHTPNHRWVVCAALGLAMQLFPEIPARAYVNRILAEGIDINADGEFTERSTGIYNAVCNRCLRDMADTLDRPELLDHVRKNLDFMAHVLHHDGSVVTSFSTRQDQGQHVVPVGMIDSLFDMAQRDGNGVWASIADLLFDRGHHQHDHVAGSSLLQPFLQNPAYRHDRLLRQPIPDNYRKHFTTSGLWRVKRGALSATAMTGERSIFSLRFGKVCLRGVKISGAYHGHPHARPTEMHSTTDGVQLLHYGRTTDFAGFFLPLNRPVPFGRFREAESLREKWSLPDFDLTINITEVDHGFDFELTSQGGRDRIPMEIEFSFDGHGEWETRDCVMPARPQQSVVLKSGHGTFRVGDEAITIGPGSYSHCDLNMRESQPTIDAFRVLVTFASPVQQKIEIRYGHWSMATRNLRAQNFQPNCS